MQKHNDLSRENLYFPTAIPCMNQIIGLYYARMFGFKNCSSDPES